jgi:surface carbohydrate biosynthesis protein
MIQRNLSLLIPVENQVRELDPKLLLACVAATKGFPSVIGPRREVHFRIPSFPRSVYLSKSVTAASELVFRILRKLGHEVVAWDEEALVHLPEETYYSRRLSPTALESVSRLFAWGDDNAEMWRRYPDLPRNLPIHVTGNPRVDLLRPEMHGFYDREVATIREQHGDFILVNTNFNHVNAFSTVQNLFQPPRREGELPPFGRAARGMTRAYAEGLRDHKQAVLENFKGLIPALERAFPDHVIVVRPHPTENQAVYREMASRCERVHVTNEGNVVPWLLATKALVHNGCTTGVEAYVMGVPAVSYRATVDERYDDGFYRLPNKLSHQCFDFESLRETLERVFRGELGVAGGEARRAVIDRYLAGREGPLACERIVSVLEQMVDGPSGKGIGVADRIHGWALCTGRTLIKRFNAYLPGSHNRPAFQRHRYPGVSPEAIRDRVARFQKILKRGARIEVEAMGGQFFRISGL